MQSQVQEIKDKLDILEIARAYLGELRRSGVNYFALCPFHHEKTPSFAINSELGIYKCFGCGESGDVLTLIQKMEGVDFPKALEIAAKRAGITLIRHFSPEEDKRHKEAQTILKLNALVSNFYQFVLEKHKMGKAGREYAAKRNLTKALIDKFKIGYAPNSYTSLLRFLAKKGYNEKQLVKWGLIVSQSGKVYDKFRNRLIFPLMDHNGDIVGFSGRIILSQTKAPKYLHSPLTSVFNKSSFLFGLFQAKKAVREKDFVVFCEGQLDVISSHKTSVSNIVAALGTSLAFKQLELAKRYTHNIYFCYDNDLAGEKALLRSAELAYQAGMRVKVVTIPEGKDADEFINLHKDKWEEIVAKAEFMVDHLSNRLAKRIDISSIEGKEEFVSIIGPIIRLIPSDIEKNQAVHKVASILNISEQVLISEIRKLSQERNLQVHSKRPSAIRVYASSREAIEEYLIALIIQHKQFLDQSLKNIRKNYISREDLREILEKLSEYRAKTKKDVEFNAKSFLSSLPDNYQPVFQLLTIRKLHTYYELEKPYIEELNSVIAHLKSFYQKEALTRLMVKAEQAQSDERKELEIVKKLAELAKELK